MTEWNQREISGHTPAAQDGEQLQAEEIVMLMQGKNAFNERVYCYLKLTVDRLRAMKEAIIHHQQFSPSDYGEVLAAGQGQPSPELRAEMAVTYSMQEAPTLEPQRPENMQKPLWDEENDDSF
ncbi:MAG: hypothetical protein F6K62_10565 [Sphaerospermopsis sp. SIO1G2]|nr:hypothetical protein [Sphaerospermopsis sp. SIO1G2]